MQKFSAINMIQVYVSISGYLWQMLIKQFENIFTSTSTRTCGVDMLFIYAKKTLKY